MKTYDAGPGVFLSIYVLAMVFLFGALINDKSQGDHAEHPVADTVVVQPLMDSVFLKSDIHPGTYYNAAHELIVISESSTDSVKAAHYLEAVKIIHKHLFKD